MPISRETEKLIQKCTVQPFSNSEIPGGSHSAIQPFRNWPIQQFSHSEDLPGLIRKFSRMKTAGLNSFSRALFRNSAAGLNLFFWNVWGETAAGLIQKFSRMKTAGLNSFSRALFRNSAWMAELLNGVPRGFLNCWIAEWDPSGISELLNGWMRQFWIGFGCSLERSSWIQVRYISTWITYSTVYMTYQCHVHTI